MADSGSGWMAPGGKHQAGGAENEKSVNPRGSGVGEGETARPLPGAGGDPVLMGTELGVGATGESLGDGLVFEPPPNPGRDE